MKTRIFIFILMAICGHVHSVAQSIGIRPALNFAMLDGELGGVNAHSDHFTGLDFSLLYVQSLSPGVDFSPELHYIEKGGDKFDESEPAEIRLHYLEICPAFRFSFSDNERLQPFLLISPYLGHMLSGEENGEMLAMDDVNRFDYGIVSGLGLQSNLGSSTIGIDLRYNYGLADYNNSMQTEAGNRAFNLGIYLLLAL